MMFLLALLKGNWLLRMFQSETMGRTVGMSSRGTTSLWCLVFFLPGMGYSESVLGWDEGHQPGPGVSVWWSWGTSQC